MTTQQLTYQYPNEIFDRISYYLTAKQNGICQTVCRSWRILFAPSQYRHIQLQGRRQFNQFYNSLNSSFVGHYIRRLSVDDVRMTAHELNSLPALCPNLVALSFNGKSVDTDTLDEFNTSSEVSFSHWKYLRRLTELQDLTVTNYLLSSNLSPLSSLTHLSIRFRPEDGISKTNFFNNLHRAKDLQSLSLDSVSLSLTDMETIHHSCPYLQKLELTNVKLKPIGYSVQEKRVVASQCFTPAVYMEKFEFKNSGDLYENYEWLYYISIKYRNLINLELWCEYSVNTHNHEVPPTIPDLEERCGALASIGMSCINLKSVKLFNITMNHWLFQAMDSARTQLEDIALGDMTDNTIDLLQYLGESNQNVSSLTLWGWPSLCIQETMKETISVLGQCSNQLSSLTISMQFSGIKNPPMPFDLLLNMCHKLEYLKLDNIQATLISTIEKARDNMNNDYAAYGRPQLCHVAFENGSFRNEIFEYLAIRCPSLARLEIASCALIEGRSSEMEIKIHMPCHTFESISISYIRPPSNYYHLNRANDIRLFDISQLKTNDLHRVYELVDYENFTSNLTFKYEQKPLEFMRPTKYISHGNISDGDRSTSPLVSIQCQTLIEFKIGGFWVI